MLTYTIFHKDASLLKYLFLLLYCSSHNRSPSALLRQRNPHLHTRPRIYCRRRRGYIWIHSSLVEIEFKVYPVADVEIYRRTNGNFLAAIGGKGVVLIQATVGTNVVPHPEIKTEIDLIMAEEKM